MNSLMIIVNVLNVLSDQAAAAAAAADVTALRHSVILTQLLDS